MKKFLFFCFLLPTIGFSQYQLSGILTDAKTKETLPFATIRIDDFHGTITNVDGKFTLTSTEEITKIQISYIGYESLSIDIPKNATFIKIVLHQNIESLNEIVISNAENPALKIIRNTINNKDKNNIEKKLNSFKFKAYNKLLITANPDSISGAIDTIYKIKNGIKEIKRIDSTNYEFKKTIDRHHLYLTEKVSEHTFEKGKKKKETILASRMAGFKQPLYEFFAITIQDFSFYNDFYTIAGTKYINPIAKNALKHYDYKILDTVKTEKGNSFMIYFKPKEKGKTVGLEGVLYIDNTSFAITSAIAELRGIIDIKATQDFTYYKSDSIWFPTNTHITIKKGENDEALLLFGGMINFSNSKKDSTLTSTKKNDPSDISYFSSKTTNFEIEINKPIVVYKSANTIRFLEDADEKSEAYWNTYRTDSLTKRGKETYIVIDSLSEDAGVEKKLNFARNILKGYLPTKYLNLDLGRIINLNNYEGFRFGFGGITNTNFAKKYRLESYVAYGTKDGKFKYHIGGAFRLNRASNTWIGAGYTDDLKEAAKLDFINENTSFSLMNPRNLNISKFYKYRTYNIYLEHDIQPNLEAIFDLSTGSYEPTFDYTYISINKILSNYKLTMATVGIKYNPKNEYMDTPIGKVRIKNGFPQFTLQIAQSFNNVLESDFGFTQVNFKAVYDIKRLRKSTTSFLLQGGIVFGEAPITHLYNATPNYTYKSPWITRVTFAGRNSFETMGYNEFISDKYVMLQVKHKITRFKITNGFKPQVSLVTRVAIGDIDNPINHNGFAFKKMNKGYFESGLEINSLIYGLGISGFYRYGAYHNPIWSDNLAIKATYHLNLGF